MPQRPNVNIEAIRRDLKHGRYREIQARDKEFQSLGLAGQFSGGSSVGIESFKCASYYCEVLDQCGRYQDVAAYLLKAGIREKQLTNAREQCEERLIALLDSQRMPKQTQKQILDEIAKLRAVCRLILQVRVADIRRGVFNEAERGLKALVSCLRRVRVKASASNLPENMRDPSHGLEGLIHYWIGRTRLLAGRNVESVPAFKRAIRETYESLHWHKSVDASSQLEESLAYSQYQMASSLAFGFAYALDLQGRLEDAMALLWPAAVVFMGQADEIRYGYTLMMLGSLTRTTAGSMGSRKSTPRSQTIIHKDLEKSTDLLKQALKCFIGSDGSSIHHFYCARAHLNLALTELRHAENSASQRTLHLKNAEDHLDKSEEHKAYHAVDFIEPIFDSNLHVAKSRVYCARGDHGSAIEQTRRAKEILSGSGIHLGVHYNRACFAEIEALIHAKHFSQATESIAEITRNEELDQTSAVYLLLYESELEWHLGQSARARALHGKAADKLHRIENTWVKLKFDKIAQLMPVSDDLSLNVNTLQQIAHSKNQSLWVVAQEELAKKLLLSTEADEGGVKRTQAKQAEYLGIDRAYLNKVRKKLLPVEG